MSIAFDVNKVEFSLGGRDWFIETGKVARQADGAVIVGDGENRVMVAVVGSKRENTMDFFPLTVDYQEKQSGAGRIPGNFFRREGRPSEKEILTCRLIDRPCRPLFDKAYNNETQIIANVISGCDNYETDVAAMIGASAALAISGLPFKGPLAAARVGWIDNNYVINPSNEQLVESGLDMVVAGTKDAIMMVESEAKQLSEDVMKGAIMFAHEQMQVVIDKINELAKVAGKPARVLEAVEESSAIAVVAEQERSAVEQAYTITSKGERHAQLDKLRAAFSESNPEIEGSDIKEAYYKLEKQIVRQRLIEGQPRIDGRDANTVRPISIEVGYLPGAHGSVLFTRGETQAIVTATIASEKSSQLVENFQGIFFNKFILHYNFPPFSVGETGRMMGPKRREIGHGNLARRAIKAVMPDMEELPYTIRLLSDITESNGSSSMATVCGSSLALMDAGIIVSDQVAGIAMGLVLEQDKHVVLTDILGDEDHLGDMDFKVAGTASGITALQMDIKVAGINESILTDALANARSGLNHILGIMNEQLSEPRVEMHKSAPRLTVVQVPPEKIGAVIGRGGAVIRKLQEDFEADINIDDDGTLSIYTRGQEAADGVVAAVEELVSDPEVGQDFDGKVVTIKPFGAFVAIGPDREGLVHISEVANQRIENISDYLKEGDEVKVRLIDIDDRGRLKLSIKETGTPAEPKYAS